MVVEEIDILVSYLAVEEDDIFEVWLVSFLMKLLSLHSIHSQILRI